MNGGANSTLVRRGTILSLAVLVVFLAAWQWGPGLLGIPPTESSPARPASQART